MDWRPLVGALHLTVEMTRVRPPKVRLGLVQNNQSSWVTQSLDWHGSYINVAPMSPCSAIINPIAYVQCRSLFVAGCILDWWCDHPQLLFSQVMCMEFDTGKMTSYQPRRGPPVKEYSGSRARTRICNILGSTASTV